MYSNCCYGSIIGSLFGAIALAAVLTLWMTSNNLTITTSSSTITTSTTVTTSTLTSSSTTTSTTTTSTTTTTSVTTSTSSSTATTTTSTTTSTSVTTSTSSSTETTTTSTTTSTSVTTSTSSSTETTTTSTTTSTSVTTSTSSSTSTTTSTSVTTSTSSSTATTTTSKTTSTSVTTSTTTTSTTTTNPCTVLNWNKTGKIVVAGGVLGGSGPKQLSNPRGIYIDSDDTLYICDSGNNRIQKWTSNAAVGETVAGDGNVFVGPTATNLNGPNDITFDRTGYMYVVDQEFNRVQRYAPNSAIGKTVAGAANGNLGTSNNRLWSPRSIAVDNDLNIYITDSTNNRVMKWAPNATSGTVFVSSSTYSQPYGIILKDDSSNEIYVSDTFSASVDQWFFGASQPNNRIAGVNMFDLSQPYGIIFDFSGNLYVADRGKQSVLKFCVGSTTPIVVVGGSGTVPANIYPIDIAFDSNWNLYVSDDYSNAIIKFDRL